MPRGTAKVILVDYDALWPQLFAQLSARIWPAVAQRAVSIEHVGSTSIPGLPGKPVIDIDIVTRVGDTGWIIEQLASLGYQHRGDLGVPHRQSFRAPVGAPIHHLYSCVEGCLSLRNHLTFRDQLRNDVKLAEKYGELKRALAAQHPGDIDAYVAGKSDFIAGVLRTAGFSADEIHQIVAVNKIKA